MKPIPLRRAQSGSFLLEALISVVIFAMGLIALVGMSAQAINQVGQSKFRNDASYLASELIGEMWVSPNPLANYDNSGGGASASDPWIAHVGTDLPDGLAAVKVTGTQVDIAITWANKEDPNARHQYVTSTTVVKNP